jgi:predicted TIM-barrel fold metal-dependent hydrolase
VRVEDLILVSVDDHLVEPPELFEGRLPARFQERAPRVVRQDDGSDVWVYEGQEIPNIGLNAVAGRPKEEYGVDPTCFDELRPGTYDVHERVRDMDANGVLGSMSFPSFPQFAGQAFAKPEDKDLALAVLQAYNDWHVEAWCGSYPDRLIPLCVLPLWDAELAAAEVRRLSSVGCHNVAFSENPEKLGFPSFHDDAWDPLWRAVSDEGTLVNMHLGSSSEVVITSMAAPITAMITLQPFNMVQAATDLLWSRVVREFPDVRLALSEGGIGWIPYLLERADYVYANHATWTGVDFGGKLPSEVFRERFVTCFIDDAAGLRLRDLIGVENICWESDYPHSDGTWPTSPERLHGALEAAGVTDDEVRKITHENAMRELRFDPYGIRPKERCTVEALRSESPDVDLAIRSSGKPFEAPEEPLTIVTLLEKAAKLLEAASASPLPTEAPSAPPTEGVAAGDDAAA